MIKCCFGINYVHRYMAYAFIVQGDCLETPQPRPPYNLITESLEIWLNISRFKAMQV